MRRFLLFFLCLFVGTSAAFGQSREQNNLWVMWERVVSGEETSRFRSHLMLDVPAPEAQAFFRNLTPSARKYGAADVGHASSPLCLAEEPAETGAIDTAGLELVDKTTTLRGLTGVYVDFRAVRGPRTFEGDYGLSVHKYVIATLEQAGIPILTKEELLETPGRPTLSFRYSAEVSGCRPWSVSLGLKQTTVLTRDTSMMLEATTWSTSARQSEEDIDYNSLNALRDAVAIFTSDFAKANSVTAAELAKK